MLQHVACCWLKFENGQIFLATFWTLHGVVLIWPRSCNIVVPEHCAIQHVATGWPNILGHIVLNNVAICCVEMLRAFGQFLHNISQHEPTMLRYVVLKCCERLAGA